MAVARQRVVPVELAEAAAEVDVLLARDVLVAKEQDAVIEKRVVDFSERALAHRFTDVDAQNFGAQRMRKAAQIKCHECIAPFVTLGLQDADCDLRTRETTLGDQHDDRDEEGDGQQVPRRREQNGVASEGTHRR